MSELSRKNFLRFVAASLGSLGSLYLAGCLNQEKLLSRIASPGKTSPTPFSPDPTKPENTDTPEPTPTETPVPSPTPLPADLAVARSGKAREMVRATVMALGGMGAFVKPGDVVVVKPNICVAYHTFEYAATTNPNVVGELVKLAFEAGAKQVKVMDFPFGGSGEQAYYRSGIRDQVVAAGGKMVVMSGIKFIQTSIPQGKSLTSARIFDDVLKADVLINVPIAKHHGLARLTLAMKNLMGVIYNRPALHANLGQRLADLSTRVRSHLVIVDAFRMLMANGPSGGNLADVRIAKTIIASPDIVAADTYAASLFGYQPDQLGYIKKGAQMGLGVKDLSKLKIEEITFG
jgi:uncharacterized protein (DUF362 family)